MGNKINKHPNEDFQRESVDQNKCNSVMMDRMREYAVWWTVQTIKIVLVEVRKVL